GRGFEPVKDTKHANLEGRALPAAPEPSVGGSRPKLSGSPSRTGVCSALTTARPFGIRHSFVILRQSGSDHSSSNASLTSVKERGSQGALRSQPNNPQLLFPPITDI